MYKHPEGVLRGIDMTTPTLGEFQERFADNLLTESLSFNESQKLLSHFVPMFKDSDVVEEAEDRFAIYRNNVVLSLSTAIADTFPVVKRLVGEDCFKTVSISFIRKFPPVQPSLLYYGKAFIDFISSCPGCSHLDYLSDVANLEWNYIRAFHAEDIKPLNIEILQQIEPEKLGDISFALQPSVHLMESPWPVDSIWHENLKQDVAEIDLQECSGSNLLIYRNEMQVQVINLTVECFYFLSALAGGKSITKAWINTLEKLKIDNRPVIDDSELVGMLGYLLGLSLFTGIRS